MSLKIVNSASTVATLCRHTGNALSLSLAIITLASPAIARAPGTIPDIAPGGHPNIKSATALVIDLGDNSVLYEKDADVVRPIASISKLFAALVFVEDCKLDPEGLHEMSAANRDAARGGDKTKLNTGWSYSHKDLLHAALMRSDNRAMPALAEACGMDTVTYAAKMTDKARRLGLTKTNFKEPDGLSRENTSTAREVMVALREAIKIGTLTEIMGKTEYTLTAHKDKHERQIKIRNTDRLLSKNIAQILGGKTGYTDIARYCLAVAARTFQGREVGMVFLGGEGRYTRFADFTRVIRWLTSDKAIAAEASKAPQQPFAKSGGTGPETKGGSGSVLPSSVASSPASVEEKTAKYMDELKAIRADPPQPPSPGAAVSSSSTQPATGQSAGSVSSGGANAVSPATGKAAPDSPKDEGQTDSDRDSPDVKD